MTSRARVKHKDSEGSGRTKVKFTKFGVMAFIAAVANVTGSVWADAPVISASQFQKSKRMNSQYAAVIPTAYSCGDAPVSGCESCDPSCGCEEVSCDGGCDSAGGGGGDEPFKLISSPIAGISFGGWTSVGYHTTANNLSFNTFPDNVQLGQQWFWAERIADGSKGLGIGGRIDYLYGTDAPDTQAFGTTVPHWDQSWDNGPQYGHAIPQLYGEVAMGDMSIKLGKFFTLIGNEVVGATGNFFYSRQFMFYNAEPFTHTGALSTYNVSDDTQLFNGYVMGWDSGFQDNGDAYLGGFKHKLNDTWTVLYATCLGRFADGNTANPGENGWIHSVLLTGSLSDNLTYISQWDALQTDNFTGAQQRNTIGTNQYLIYKLTDKVALGQRFEWFNQSVAGAAPVPGQDVYNYTVGLNYAYNANVMFRPELRQVWDKTGLFNEGGRSSQMSCGGDMVFVF
jgi:hypothetical protein